MCCVGGGDPDWLWDELPELYPGDAGHLRILTRPGSSLSVVKDPYPLYLNPDPDKNLNPDPSCFQTLPGINIKKIISLPVSLDFPIK